MTADHANRPTTRKKLPTRPRKHSHLDHGGVRKLQRRKPTVNTLGQSLAKSPELLLPRLPFSRLVREIVDAVSPTSHQLKLSEDAKEVLQEISEMWLLTVFGAVDGMASHAQRVTVMPSDLHHLCEILMKFDCPVARPLLDFYNQHVHASGAMVAQSRGE